MEYKPSNSKDPETFKAEHSADDAKKGTLAFVDIQELHVPRWKLFLSLFGFPVEEEAYATHKSPWISFGFIGICSVLFFFFPGSTILLALDPVDIFAMNGANLVSYALVHADIFHFFSNMLFALPFMDNTEEDLGRVRYFFFLILGAISSAAAHLMFEPRPMPLVGASGLCFGIASYYCFRFPKNRFLVAVPILGIFAMFKRIRIRAWLLLIFWGFFEFFGAWEQSAGFTEVSHLGHVGGMVVGLCYAKFGTKRSSPQNLS